MSQIKLKLNIVEKSDVIKMIMKKILSMMLVLALLMTGLTLSCQAGFIRTAPSLIGGIADIAESHPANEPADELALPSESAGSPIPMPPLITFEQDIDGHSLTVVAVQQQNIKWTDIDVEHEGSIIGISDDGDGYVDPGEAIFGLYGHTEIYYEPTNTLIATFEFPPMPPFFLIPYLRILPSISSAAVYGSSSFLLI